MYTSMRPSGRGFIASKWMAAAAMGLCALTCRAQLPAAPATSLATQFQNPPQAAKPLAYWWWLNGHTDNATITHDLEAMKQEGYAGAILMDANGSDQQGNAGVPAGPEFASAEWQAMFLHTLKEAQRLGLQISLTIQSGWNVGGPNVTGAQSAKLLTWSRQVVHGAAPVTVELPQPPMKNGFYRDIAVLAYPLRHGAALAGDDGRRPIRDLAQKAAFRETGISVPDSKPLLGDYPATPGEQDFDLHQEVNLTGKMSTDGKLTWTPPSGDWEILRIGYTSSDARVSTGSGKWQGLVIDYMDRDALTQYWNKNVQPMLTAAKPYLGKSLRYVYTDSWEVGGINWTGRFRQEFIKRRGYDPVPYLPVVTGRIVTSREVSDRFLNDLRRTVGDLILSDHYAVMGALAAKNGLGFHPESGGPHGAPIDALQLLGADTFPQSEFWAQSKMHRTSDLDRFFVKEASSAAHIYGKTWVAAEGFTSIGPQWEESPGMDLKPTFDQAICAGLNKLVWHTFTSSPASMGLPGQEYFAGTHFNPNVTWFKDGKSFFEYMTRTEFMMQQGLPVSDVLYYYGDHVPNLVQYKGADPAHVLPGYDYDVLDQQILTTGLTVAHHRIRLANGTEYSELVLPPLTNISLPALKAVQRLVLAGATVVGEKPTHLTGLPTAQATDAEVQKIADRLWGGCTDGKGVSKVGAGQIVCGLDARQALVKAGIQPDLRSAGPAPDKDFDYIHRRDGQTEVYFVRNTKPEAVATVLSFRVKGMAPEIWNPQTGEIERTGLYANTKEGRTEIPVWFGPYGSRLVVFRHAAGAHVASLERDGQQIFPQMSSNAAPVSVQMQEGRMLLRSTEGGEYTGITASGAHLNATVSAQQVTSVAGPWTLSFPPNWGAPAQITMQKLASWTDSDNDGVKYFSGTATYTNQFMVPEHLPAHARVLLYLGNVKETARVWINGKPAGVLWRAPFALDVTALVHSGSNDLKVAVTNFWPNRIIGDKCHPDQKPYTHTEITKYSADSPLMPSGLLGPVTVRVTAGTLLEAGK